MIFNKTKKGSAELYNLTGTWYKANDFTGISEDIVLAQNEVIKLIGKATFDRAHSRYMTDEYDPEVSSDDPEDMLVRRGQFPGGVKNMHHFYPRKPVGPRLFYTTYAAAHKQWVGFWGGRVSLKKKKKILCGGGVVKEKKTTGHPPKTGGTRGKEGGADPPAPPAQEVEPEMGSRACGDRPSHSYIH